MTALLAQLQSMLDPEVKAAGFAPADQAAWDNLAWIEYRAQDADGVRLLDIFYVNDSAEQVITAELWRPTRLVQALRSGHLERAASHRLAWQWCDERPERLEAEIVATVGTWLQDTQLKGDERALA